jgi:predicted PurR-regulated permease PerM
MARIVQSNVEPAASSSAAEEDASLTADKPFVSEQSADIRVVFQGGLFMLALLAALYAGREIVLPIVLAIILNLLLQPALRMLERFYLPRMLGALILIALLFGTIVALVTGMSGPASSWAAKLPEGVPRLQEHLSFPRAPIDAVLLRFSPTAHTPVTPRDSHLIAAMEKRQLHLQESLVRFVRSVRFFAFCTPTASHRGIHHRIIPTGMIKTTISTIIDIILSSP